MAELGPDEESWMKMLRPGPGYFTWSAVLKRLGCPSRKMHAYCKALGIEITPFVREEPYLRKVYRHGYRWLTDDEVKRLIAYHHSQRDDD